VDVWDETLNNTAEAPIDDQLVVVGAVVENLFGGVNTLSRGAASWRINVATYGVGDLEVVVERLSHCS
jgi:hypothetical protein